MSLSKFNKFVTVLLTCLSSISLAAKPVKDIEERQKLFSGFDKATYYLGDMPSRFAWQNMPAFFGHVAINSDLRRDIPQNIDPSIAAFEVHVEGKRMSLEQYVLGDKRIDSMIVVHKGKLAFEHYNSHGPLDRHIAWSITKVIVAATLANLQEKNKIDMQASLDTYLPDFKGADWGKVSLQDIADMRSGIDCRDNDGFNNPDSCVLIVDEIFGVMPNKAGRKMTARSYLRSVKAHREPAQTIEYSSANTLILGYVIETIAKKPLHKVIAEYLWQPMGAEADALMIVNGYGEAYAVGGISARLLDIARFGMLYLDKANSNSVLSNSHISELFHAQRSKFSEGRLQMLSNLFDDDLPKRSLWQWDLVWDNGDLYKDGFSGQGLYVSPNSELVIAWFGTADKHFNKHALLPIARKLANAQRPKAE